MNGLVQYHGPTSDGGRTACRRDIRRYDSGVLEIAQEMSVTGRHAYAVVMGGTAMLEVIHVTRGHISFRVGGEHVVAPPRFLWFLPAYSVTHADFSNATYRMVAIATFGDGLASGPGRSAIRSTPDSLLAFPPLTPEMLNDTRWTPVEACAPSESLAGRVKSIIDRAYRGRVSLSRLANTLDIRHEHLTRVFRRAYGISPLRYLHPTRCVDALFHLSSGEAITSVCHDVGYRDLSGFYRQFRQFTGSHRGDVCRSPHPAPRRGVGPTP